MNAQDSAERVEAHEHEIVVGVDGSPPGWNALEWAARLADDRGLGLRVLHALSMPLVTMPIGRSVRVTPPPEVADRATEFLDQAVERVRHGWPRVAVESQVSSLEPAPALIAAADRAALVIVGSRGLGAARTAFQGSVSVRVCAHAACPVVVVPAELTEAHEERPRVVVGVDGSPHSTAALGFALEETARRGAELVAVHAWQPPTSVDPLMLAEAGYALDREVLRERTETYVRGLVDEARSGESVDVPARIVVTEDQTTRALLWESERAALLVVGSRGRGGFLGLLLGSVSQTLLHYATVPVAVVRPDSQ